MGWTYVPGCNIARGAEGDNSAQKFGETRKSTPNTFPTRWTRSVSLCKPSESPIPYVAAMESARPPSANCDVKLIRESSAGRLKAKKGNVGARVRLNKEYCPEIDLVGQMARGRLPSHRLRFNFPDLFPEINEDEWSEHELRYEEPTRLVDSSSMLRALVPSTPWRYLQGSWKEPVQAPLVSRSTSPHNPRQHIHAQQHQTPQMPTAADPAQAQTQTEAEHKICTRDAQCQTICEAGVQTDEVHLHAEDFHQEEPTFSDVIVLSSTDASDEVDVRVDTPKWRGPKRVTICTTKKKKRGIVRQAKQDNSASNKRKESAHRCTVRKQTKQQQVKSVKEGGGRKGACRAGIERRERAVPSGGIRQEVPLIQEPSSHSPPSSSDDSESKDAPKQFGTDCEDVMAAVGIGPGPNPEQDPRPGDTFVISPSVSNARVDQGHPLLSSSIHIPSFKGFSGPPRPAPPCLGNRCQEPELHNADTQEAAPLQTTWEPRCPKDTFCNIQPTQEANHQPSDLLVPGPSLGHHTALISDRKLGECCAGTGHSVSKSVGDAKKTGEGGRNSLESLAELERLIEDQHRQLVERGILSPDYDVVDSPSANGTDTDARSLDEHLASLRKVAYRNSPLWGLQQDTNGQTEENCATGAELIFDENGGHIPVDSAQGVCGFGKLLSSCSSLLSSISGPTVTSQDPESLMELLNGDHDDFGGSHGDGACGAGTQNEHRTAMGSEFSASPSSYLETGDGHTNSWRGKSETESSGLDGMVAAAAVAAAQKLQRTTSSTTRIFDVDIFQK